MPVTSYSRTPASNNAAPPNGAPEGWAPGSMNNTVRQIMTDIVNESGKNLTKVLSGVAGTNTITAAMSPALDAYSAGMLVVFTPAATNTAAVTINIDSLGALDIQKGAGSALTAGDLTIGIPALLLLDSGADDFILVNPQNDASSGTYTPTLTNTANITSSTASVTSYMRVGNMVQVSGVVTAVATAGGSFPTELRMSLPIASNLSASTQLGGVASLGNGSLASIIGNATSDVASFSWFSAASGSATISFTFGYIVQ